MPTPSDLADLPKCEVHVHLEGAVRPGTLEELAAREGVSVPHDYRDLNGFIAAYIVASRTMTSPGDYARIVREYCEDAARCGIRYAELELSPSFGRTSECLAEAAEAAANERDVVVRFTVGLGRADPVENAWKAIEDTRDIPGVVAVGLGGPEQGNPPELWGEVFGEARRRGLRSAPHAGETVGPESVRGALNALKADRIQHGVRTVEDPALLAELAERRVPLAVCPTSNVRLGVVPSLDEHPLRQLWDAGVVVSVNTDDPGFFGCDLTGEYAIAGRLLHLDRAGYARLARNSVESSFAPEALKSELRAAIANWAARG